jgi:hypothetical protein
MSSIRFDHQGGCKLGWFIFCACNFPKSPYFNNEMEKTPYKSKVKWIMQWLINQQSLDE